MRRFEGQTVLVTGGGGGIGSATVQRFAEEGARIAVADIDINKAQMVVDSLPESVEAMALQVDVTDPADCERMVAKILVRFGALHVVFANAGISRTGLVADIDPADWSAVININLTGVFLTCKYSIPALIAAGGGAIVTMSSSMAGWDTSPGGAAYMASKEGVSGLTKSLALQLGRHGIRANAICPGIIRTRLNFSPDMSEADWQRRYDDFSKRIPTGRVGEPEDVAAVVAFLASNDARHISGSTLLIDGGQTLQSWSNAPHTETYPSEGLW
ncbi:MAG: SDR family oxidoreductase [Thermomicrobiales bacterium]|nr:SDR family oxidoreductase [Thermomicrobiales bacterium]